MTLKILSLDDECQHISSMVTTINAFERTGSNLPVEEAERGKEKASGY
jgi:hypothetical protein